MCMCVRAGHVLDKNAINAILEQAIVDVVLAAGPGHQGKNNADNAGRDAKQPTHEQADEESL